MLIGDCRGWWIGGQQTFRVTGLLSKEGRAQPGPAWNISCYLKQSVCMQDGKSVGMTEQPDFS